MPWPTRCFANGKQPVICHRYVHEGILDVPLARACKSLQALPTSSSRYTRRPFVLTGLVAYPFGTPCPSHSLSAFQVGDASGDADDGAIDDTHLYTEALTTKPPPGPEMGFAGTALSGNRRLSPPPPPQPPSTGAETPTRAVDASMEVEEKAGVVHARGDYACPQIDCPTCTMINHIIDESITQCAMCGGKLFLEGT